MQLLYFIYCPVKSELYYNEIADLSSYHSL